jgi:uncharacterized phage-like protein YoqJ
MYSISLTGHRPDKLWGYNLNNKNYQLLFNQLLKIIEENIKKHGNLTCHSGMALGADTVWAYAIIHAKEKFPGQIKFVAEVPFTEQTNKWRHLDKVRWNFLHDKADAINVYSNEYYPYVMQKRNIGMIDACDLLIAVYNGSVSGGTHNALKYAKSKDKEIVYINPSSISK